MEKMTDNVSQVVKLLHEVPLPPGERVPGGVADAELDAFTTRTGIHMPSSLRTWLAITNAPSIGAWDVFGIESRHEYLNIEHHYQRLPAWKQKKWIPVAGDGRARYYVLITWEEFGPGFPVVYVDANTSVDKPAFIVASDLWCFLRALLEKERSNTRWPFDKDELLAFDPEIARFEGVAMPWD